MSNVCPLDYRYGREDMKAVFSEESRIFYQMQVEAALARNGLQVLGRKERDGWVALAAKQEVAKG